MLADRAVLGQVAAGLAHHPHRPALGRLAAAGAQEEVVHAAQDSRAPTARVGLDVGPRMRRHSLPYASRLSRTLPPEASGRFSRATGQRADHRGQLAGVRHLSCPTPGWPRGTRCCASTAHELRIEDLGTRKGMLVSGRKVREAALEVLDEIRLGGVTLLVEDIAPGRTEEPAPPAEAAAGRPPHDHPERMIEHLSRISEWVLADTESRTTSEALVERGAGGLRRRRPLPAARGRWSKAGLKLVVTHRLRLAGGRRASCVEQLLDTRDAEQPATGAAPSQRRAGGTRRRGSATTPSSPSTAPTP